MPDSTPVEFSDADRRTFAKIVARTWTDAEFAQRYLIEPRSVLREHGIEYPEDALVPPVPPRPDGELSLDELEMAAGACAGSVGTAGTASCPLGCAGTFGSAFCYGEGQTLPA
jgi:putative thiazole/oxazole-modified microcin (TOMM)-like peptide